MGKVVTCVQPTFLGPLYLYERLSNCDIVIVLTQAQFDKQHVRNEFPGQMNTLPTHGNGRQTFNETTLAEYERWLSKLQKTLKMAYQKEPQYKMVTELVIRHLEMFASGQDFVDVAGTMMASIMMLTGIDAHLVPDTEVLPMRPESGSEWMAHLVRSVGGTHYLQGRTGYESYLMPEHFDGINLWYQDWDHPQANLSVLHHMYRNPQSHFHRLFDRACLDKRSMKPWSVNQNG